ncbi:MAG: M55 family metallopeptidase, partial [Terriglobales bacterium]
MKTTGMRRRWMAASVLALLVALAAEAQQKGVKVYISADMEGIAGLVDTAQTAPTGREYALGRRLMTAEVNAAIAAAFEAGATEVLVNDSH